MHFQEYTWCSKQDMFPCHISLISLVSLQKSLFSQFLFLVFLSTFSQFPHLIFRFESGYTKKKKCASLIGQSVKNLPAVQETQVLFLGWEDLLEKEMATHSSILDWRIPQREEPRVLQSMGSHEQNYGLTIKPPTTTTNLIDMKSQSLNL